MAGKRAPSCHISFDDHSNGDIILQDVLVPAEGLSKCTYYCCMQWNGGQEGGGYCGIQDHPDGRCFIFSIWDPIESSEAIQSTFKGNRTIIEKFGGEGTGLKSMNFNINWKPDQWYTLVAKRWSVNCHSFFGFWVHDQIAEEWHHLVTMDFPVANVYFTTPTVSFIEDWYGNGENSRRVHFRNGFKRTLNKSWLPFRKGKFSVLQEDACMLYNENYDGGILHDCFFMQTGRGTTPAPILTTNRQFVSCNVAAVEPVNIPIVFDIQKVTSSQVSWIISKSSTPQFSFTITVKGIITSHVIDSEARNCAISSEVGSEVVLTIADILGKEMSTVAVIH